MTERVSLPDGTATGATSKHFGRDYWLVFAASFLLGCEENLFVLFPAYLADMGATPSVIGAMLGLGSLTALVSRPGATAAIGRRGRRSTSVWFLVLDAIAVILYAPLRGLGWGLWAVRAIHGAVEGTARVALFAMVYERLPVDRPGHAMALFSLSSVIPAALAPWGGEALVHQAGFGAFFIAGAILLMGSAGVTRAVGDERAGGSKEGETRGLAAYRVLLTDARLVPLWLGSVVFAIAVTARFSFVAPFAYSSGLRSIGWYFLMCAAVAAIARILGSRVLDAVGLGRAVGPALAVLAAGTALIAGTPSVAILAGAALIGGLGQGYSYPALSALIIARTPREHAGYSSSIFNSIFDAVGIVGPWLLGLLAEGIGYRWMFAAAGVIAMVGAAFAVPRNAGTEDDRERAVLNQQRQKQRDEA